MPLPAAERLAPGTRVGPCRIQAYAGRGASAEVYRAWHEPAACAVALKLMPPRADEHPGSASAEIRATGALDHPDIVRLIDTGREGSRDWMALEWAPGYDLSRYLTRARQLPEPVVLELIERLAAALGYAHRQGVLHRDIKPSNIRLDLPARSIKMTDFGIARAMDPTQTATGVIQGTPAYMAPEQLAGHAADAATDLYSLTVVAFELLTLRRPHQAETMGQLLRAIATEPAPRLRTLRPDLPEALDLWMARRLSRRRDERPCDAKAWSEELSALRLSWPR